MEPEQVNVIYHSPCFDGFCACLGAFLCHSNVHFYPYHPGSELTLLPALITYFLDTVTTESIFQSATSLSHQVVVIDHHWDVPALITSWNSSAKVQIIHNTEQSACILAWNHFKSKRSPLTTSEESDTEIEKILLYVQDRDLYRNALPGGEEVIAGLGEM